MCWVQSVEVTFPLELLRKEERSCNKLDCTRDTRWGMLVGDKNESDSAATFELWLCDIHIDDAERCASDTGAMIRERLKQKSGINSKKRKNRKVPSVNFGVKPYESFSGVDSRQV